VVALGSFVIGTRYEKNKLVKIMMKNEQSAMKKLAVAEKKAAVVQPIVANQVIGTVTKVDKALVTITLADATTQTVMTTPITRYGEDGMGKLTDITVGKQVAAIHTGIKNVDGSYTAALIKPAPVVTAETTPATTSKKAKTKKAKGADAATTDAANSDSSL